MEEPPNSTVDVPAVQEPPEVSQSPPTDIVATPPFSPLPFRALRSWRTCRPLAPSSSVMPPSSVSDLTAAGPAMPVTAPA